MYAHLVVAKKTQKEIREELSKLEPNAWYGRDKHSMIRKLVRHAPQHPWLRVPLRASKA